MFYLALSRILALSPYTLQTSCDTVTHLFHKKDILNLDDIHIFIGRVGYRSVGDKYISPESFGENMCHMCHTLKRIQGQGLKTAYIVFFSDFRL